jgi:uncharacterized protein
MQSCIFLLKSAPGDSRELCSKGPDQMCAPLSPEDLPEKKTTDAIPGLSAAGIIRLLDLRPHPEGGHFRETFRDPAQDANGRSVSTLIYFLLPAGDLSRWHKVDATEVWHFYAGAPLQISVSPNGSETSVHRLGPDLTAGDARNLLFPPIAGRAPKALGLGRSLWLLRCAGFRIFRLRTRSVSCVRADSRQVIPRTGKAHRLRCPSGNSATHLTPLFLDRRQ